MKAITYKRIRNRNFVFIYTPQGIIYWTRGELARLYHIANVRSLVRRLELASMCTECGFLNIHGTHCTSCTVLTKHVITKDTVCTICLENVDIFGLSFCGDDKHAIHERCMNLMIKNGLPQKCPTCREMTPSWYIDWDENVQTISNSPNENSFFIPLLLALNFVLVGMVSFGHLWEE